MTSDLHAVPEGAYNIRKNGEAVDRKQTANIQIETNKEKNVSLYNHYGFELKKEELIPETPVMHYAMVRKPTDINDQI